MIQLSLEMPTCLLPEFEPLVDLHFALAHRVLEDPEYFGFFRRNVTKELVLDNSMHELGEPLSIDDLVRAANLVQPTYMIAPDFMDDADRTLDAFMKLAAIFPRHRLGYVVSGEHQDDRVRAMKVVMKTGGAGLYCFPYRRPRMAWFYNLPTLGWGTRVHLLGMSEPEELLPWCSLSEDSRLRLSVDTSKPVKFGLLEQPVEELHSWRHPPISSKRLLEITHVREDQKRVIRTNVECLRRLLGAGR